MDWVEIRDMLGLSITPDQLRKQAVGYMEYEENPYDQNGRKYVTYKPLLTGRGQIWLTKKLTEYLNDIKRL